MSEDVFPMTSTFSACDTNARTVALGPAAKRAALTGPIRYAPYNRRDDSIGYNSECQVVNEPSVSKLEWSFWCPTGSKTLRVRSLQLPSRWPS
jgi:hypothetical protein